MGRFLDAAALALDVLGRPATADEIVDVGTSHGILQTSGETPAQTMKARLSDDIRKNRQRSRFMRTAPGEFALRAWTKQSHLEYVAARYKKALLEETALTFARTELPNFVPGPGLHTQGSVPTDVLRLCRPVLRREAEEDFSLVQLVSAFLVVYRGRYLTYKRTGRLPESRLHGVYSIMFGGHLTPLDVFGANEWPDSPEATFINLFDPVNGHVLLMREFNEELHVIPAPRMEYVGLLYDDRATVSTQHLGIVYRAHLANPDFTIGERGFLIDPKFESLKEIGARIQDFENWSELLWRSELGESP